MKKNFKAIFMNMSDKSIVSFRLNKSDITSAKESANRMLKCFDNEHALISVERTAHD